MKFRPAWSIKRYLQALIAAIALPLAGITAYLWTEEVEDRRAAAENQLRQAADHVAADLRRLHRQHAWILSQVAASPAIRGLDRDGCEQETRMVHQLHPEVFNVILWDRSGVLVCGAGDIPDATGVTNNPAQHAEGLAADGILVSNVFWERRGERHLVLFMHPVTDANGEKAALLTAGIDLDYFDQLLAELRLPDNSAAGILDQANHFLSRVPSGASSGSAGVAAVAKVYNTPGSAAITAKGIDRMSRMYVGYAVPETPWKIYVGMPSDLLLAAHRKWLVTSALLALSVLALSALGAYAVALRINRPMEALVEAADRIARGDLRTRAPQDGFAEAVRVARHFNRMVEELERSHDRLRESAARLDGVIAAAMDGIVIMSHEGNVLDFNPAAERIFGYSREMAIGRNLAELVIPPHLREDHRKGLARYLATGESRLLGRRVEIEALRADGTTFPVELTINRIASGTPPMFTGFIRDITERKQAEAALRDYAERMRYLSQRLTEIEENERRNINRELHDRVGQNLSILNLSLSRLRAQTGRPEDWRKILDDTQVMAESTIVLIRNVMADLRPPALDDFGLFAALRNHVDAYAARTGLAVELQGGAIVPRLPLATETALFRIAQEALTNVAKHARAKRVEVDLRRITDVIRLTVVDDGVGFDASDSDSPRANWGLGGMRERAEAIGATLRIESGRGKGTRVTVEMRQEAAA